MSKALCYIKGVKKYTKRIQKCILLFILLSFIFYKETELNKTSVNVQNKKPRGFRFNKIFIKTK